MVRMARLAYERMKRIDEEDHERGLKEQQYNNSVKYQRMIEYELNNPGETATVSLDQFCPVPGNVACMDPHLSLRQGVLEYEAIFKRSRRRRVKRRLVREAVANGDMEHVPVSSGARFGGANVKYEEIFQQRSLRPKKHVRRKPDPSKIVYNRFTPSVQQEEIERELNSKVSTSLGTTSNHGSLSLAPHPNSLP